MAENGLLQKMKNPMATALVGGMLITPNILSQAQKATPNADLDNKTNTQVMINYVNPSQRFFFDNVYWNFYNFDARMNRLHFRRFHEGNYVNFYLGINDLPKYNIYFNFQTHMPHYQNHNQFFNNNHNQYYNNQYYNNQFFNQGYTPQRKINPRIRNNTGRNSRK